MAGTETGGVKRRGIRGEGMLRRTYLRKYRAVQASRGMVRDKARAVREAARAEAKMAQAEQWLTEAQVREALRITREMWWGGRG